MNLAILFTSATAVFGLPPGLLDAVCYVESKHQIHAFHKDDGHANSVGICQVKLATARMLGFKGTETELMEPGTNINFAAKYLAHQYDRYGTAWESVCAYNTGSYRMAQDGLAVNREYGKKVFKVWLSQK